jgi:predicted ATPase
MQFTSLSLKNFKLFDDHKIEFKPLTLLTGPNSSGKSSILGALTTILQTRSPHLFPFEIVPNGSNISLGAYRDIAKNHNTASNIAVGIELKRGKEVISLSGEYRYASRGNQTLLNELEYRSKENYLKVKWGGEHVGYTAEYSAFMDKDVLHILTKMIEEFKRKDLTTNNGKLSGEPRGLYEAVDGNIKTIKLKGKKPFELIKELEDTLGPSFAIRGLRSSIESLFEHVEYIGPIRSFPNRHYSSEDGGSRIDPFGGNACITLADWKDHHKDKYKQTVELLALLQVASKLDTKSSDDLIRIEVQPFNHSERVNFVDVGFGVSQVLPIIISDIALKKGGTLLINQPEVHLHPSSQAAFGNYFAERLAERNYVVETHSEYLITRLRLLVAQGKLKAENVNIVFIDSENKSARSRPKIFNISITKDGAFEGAPDNFFKTYFDDSFKLAMAGI